MAGEGEAAQAPPAERAIAAPALRGTIWTIGGYGASQVLRLGSNLILTRVLFPEVFGQMALVQIFLQGLGMFSDVGTGPAIVQSPRGEDPVFLRTAWTIQAVRGVFLFLASCAIAWPVAAFYDQPLLTWLIPASGATAILGGLESTAMHTLQRKLQLERLTLVELAGQAAGIAATVGLAVLDRWAYGPDHPGAVWAIVGGGWVTALVRLALSHVALPGIRHRFQLDPGSRRALFAFGRWIFVSTMLTFLAGQSDRLVFGKLIPLDLFGVYGIAAMLSMLPTQAVLKLGGAVVFPAYSRVASRSDFRQLFGRVRLPLLLGGGAIVTGLIAGGPVLIRILYDDRYWQAGWILQFLAAVAWFQILECTVGAALLAQGRVRWVAAGSAVKVVGLLGLIPLGFWVGGFTGALVGLCVAEAAKYVTAATGAALKRLAAFGLDAALTVLIAAASALGFWAAEATAARSGAAAGFAAAALVVGTAWGAVGGWYLKTRWPSWRSSVR
jgi:O-antigen/teichoic acid export membrane protein